MWRPVIVIIIRIIAYQCIGPTIAFNIQDKYGDITIGYHTVYKLALRHNIALRTG